jgi:hypothetical protein
LLITDGCEPSPAVAMIGHVYDKLRNGAFKLPDVTIILDNGTSYPHLPTVRLRNADIKPVSDHFQLPSPAIKLNTLATKLQALPICMINKTGWMIRKTGKMIGVPLLMIC